METVSQVFYCIFCLDCSPLLDFFDSLNILKTHFTDSFLNSYEIKAITSCLLKQGSVKLSQDVQDFCFCYTGGNNNPHYQRCYMQG